VSRVERVAYRNVSVFFTIKNKEIEAKSKTKLF
jgi:hypothetical protein